MNQEISKSEKSQNFIVGIILIIIGIFFLALRFYVMPTLGLVVGIFSTGIGIYFLVKHRRGLS